VQADGRGGWGVGGGGGHTCAGVSVSVSERVCVIDLAVFAIARDERETRACEGWRGERGERSTGRGRRRCPCTSCLSLLFLARVHGLPLQRPSLAAGSRRATPPPPLLLRPLRAKGEPSACSALSRALPLAHLLFRPPPLLFLRAHARTPHSTPCASSSTMSRSCSRKWTSCSGSGSTTCGSCRYGEEGGRERRKSGRWP